MKKSNVTTFLILLLMIAGLALLLYPTASDMLFRWRAGQEIAQYNQVSEGADRDYSPLWQAAEAYNRRLAQSGSFTIAATPELTAEIAQYLNPLGTGMMGYIDIPKISVHIPIYQGTDEPALQAGAGFWLGTSLPTGGAGTHCVLTAHNGLVKAKMFTDLDQLELGDTFSLSILDRVLTYEVDQILVVEPDELEPLKIVEGEDYVTLYTCTPYGVNTHRLLVRGSRTEVQQAPVTAAPLQTAVQTAGWQRLVWMGLAAGLAILLLLLSAVRIYAGSKHGKREMSKEEWKKRKKGNVHERKQ